MSQQNVQVVRGIFESFNNGGLEDLVATTWPDVELDWSNSIGPLRGVYRGHDGVRELWAAFQDAWATMSWDPREIIDVDDSRVIVINHLRMKGRGSGAEVEAVGAQLWTFRDGKAEQMTLYQSKAAALEAVDLQG